MTLDNFIPPGPDVHRGVNFTSWYSGQYASADAATSLGQVASLQATWIALIVTAYQADVAATTIDRLSPKTPTDDDLRKIVTEARSLGLKVLLKPHIDLSNDPSHWRGQIGEGFDVADWALWFATYEEFISHYAALAEELKLEGLCVGTELTEASTQDKHWRHVIDRVRRHYRGPLTYGANWDPGPEVVKFWDRLDWVGVDAYYPLTETLDSATDLHALQHAWSARGYLDALGDLAARTEKPILITEIGWRSVRGATHQPWTFRGDEPVDLAEQAAAYEAALTVLLQQPWLRGIYFWNWHWDPARGGENDRDFTPQEKPAAEMVRRYFAR